MNFLLYSLVAESSAVEFNGPAAPQWKTVVDIEFASSGADLKTYTAREEFNKLAADATYIRYKTNKMGTAVYKRRSAWGSIDQYELFLNTWSVKGENKFHEDFDIFSSYEDALADANPWQYCNGDDKGVGFPRDCDAVKHTIFRWFAFPKDAVSEDVDFIRRFDTNYLLKSRKCYEHASFEILPAMAEAEELSCPAGWEQVGEIGTDIAGCGLQRCNERYDLADKEACAERCAANDKCKSFTWAPLDGDKNHKGERVCTMYSHDKPNRMWEGMDGELQQVFCVPAAEPEVAVEVESEAAVEVEAESESARGKWVKGDNGLTCDQVCSAEGLTCNSEGMDILTTNEAVAAAFLSVGHTCKSFHVARGYPGAPFSKNTAKDDCAPLLKGSKSVCNGNKYGHHSALCWCEGDVEVKEVQKPEPEAEAAIDINVFDFHPEDSSYDLEGVDIRGKYVKGDERACDDVCGDLGLVCNTEVKSEDSVVAKACTTPAQDQCWCEGELAFKHEIVEVDVLTPEALDMLIPGQETKDPSFVGCFKDTKQRDLSKRMDNFSFGKNGTDDRESCFAACRSAGYKYAGLQWFGQCFCDNDYGKYGPGDHCDCSRGSKEFAFWGNCVYDMDADSSSAPATTAAPETTAAPTTTAAPETTAAPVEKEELACAAGWEQVGEVGTDIAGCGLQKCNERYDVPNVEKCAERCEANENCKSFTWAPMDGDKNHKGVRVCTMYSHDKPNRMWEGQNGALQQVFCVPAKEVAVEVAPAGWQKVIDLEVSSSGSNVKVYTERAAFNEMASKATYIRYSTSKVESAVYKRRTAWGSIDQYELFVNKWDVKGENTFHKDFDIFSSYEDAVADKNPWKYCNGGDRGVGFPRDCGASRKTNWTWFAFPKGAVYTMDAIPKEIDFISRFDNRYVSGRNYKSASFEIYVDGAAEVQVEEPKQSEPAFVGCFKDKRQRDLPNRKKSFKAGNREQCFQQCSEAGFQYAGLQWTGECHCGNSYGKYGEGSKCDCERGAKKFGYWEQCIYDLAAEKALLV